MAVTESNIIHKRLSSVLNGIGDEKDVLTDKPDSLAFFTDFAKAITCKDMAEVISSIAIAAPVSEVGFEEQAREARDNAVNNNDMISALLWTDYAVISSMLTVIGRKLGFDYEGFANAVTNSELVRVWGMQENAKDSFNCNIIRVALKRIQRNQDADFWHHMVKCIDLLARIDVVRKVDARNA